MRANSGGCGVVRPRSRKLGGPAANGTLDRARGGRRPRNGTNVLRSARRAYRPRKRDPRFANDGCPERMCAIPAGGLAATLRERSTRNSRRVTPLSRSGGCRHSTHRPRPIYNRTFIWPVDDQFPVRIVVQSTVSDSYSDGNPTLSRPVVPTYLLQSGKGGRTVSPRR